jgi:hypothetical protein
MHNDDERNIALRVWFRKMIKWASSYHSINPLLQRRQSPTTITLLPPIADNFLPVLENSISAPFDQIESNSNPPQAPSSPPTVDRTSSVVGDNIPSDETIYVHPIKSIRFTYNQSQIIPSIVTLYYQPN